MKSVLIALAASLASVSLVSASPFSSALQIEQQIEQQIESTSASSSVAPVRRVEVTGYWGRIDVQGYDGDQVVVNHSVEGRAVDGAKVFRGGGPGYTVSERDRNERESVVSVVADSPEQGGRRSLDLLVRVPTRSDLKLLMDRGGEITVTGVEGAFEISSNNGSIVLDEVSGHASVDAVNGSIRASFRRVTAGKAMSFSSMNGEVDVSLPAPLRADLRVSTKDDDIECDFELENASWSGPGRAAQANESREPDPSTTRPAPPHPAATRLEAQIGGGGPLLFLSTHNGVVRIRRRSES